MLQIKNIHKKYVTGELVQKALDGVTMSFRDNEFVAVLGPSGSGKTTLLNIIGGLDRYDEGDLIIDGVSTHRYKDRDWDSYRNHSIGFVFQSYNLIPHQSVLANVELALTIGGISSGERRRRAQEALEKVGLGDQLHKKPNQMSGGQMQRVAIARALVNDPKILLADEPTGALDSSTGIQVMELLKEVAKDRLVVMVTHNGELAEQYATRLVKLRDGVITGDTAPFEPEDDGTEPVHKNMGKARMGWLTSLALSANNLRTKKGRTLLTAFAGSIGIIGIALILSLSTGVNDYIANVQKDTMTSYPITLTDEAFDMSGMIGLRGQMMGEMMDKDEDAKPQDGVYADNTLLKIGETMTSSITENDLTAFKKYIDDLDSEINKYIGENGVVYTYDVSFSVSSYDKNGVLVNTDADTDDVTQSSGMMGGGAGQAAGMASMGIIMESFAPASGAENFEELMRGADGSAVSAVVTDSYDVLYGRWPEAYDEVVLVLNSRNGIETSVMYQLGLITADEYLEIRSEIENGGEPAETKLDYADVCGHSFYMLPACDEYEDNGDGTFTYVGDNSLYTDELMEKAVELKISGVVRASDSTDNSVITSSVGYTSLLTDFVIERTDGSAVVQAQEAEPGVNVLTGMEFKAATDAEKAEDAKTFIRGMNVSNKAALFQMIMMRAAQSGEMPSASPEAGAAMGQAGMTGGAMDETSMAAALEGWLESSPDEAILVALYDEYVSGTSYEDNLTSFGKVSYDAPASISIYTDSFENKDAISDCIERYNETVDESSRITYTDYVALLTSSLTSIVDVISYVLIAFVAVSLVVSCIMIGIITHISVLERTKEIGILRALGASKRNISQVFNAETIIIGFAAGLLGVTISALLTIPINAVLAALTGMDSVRAILPWGAAVILVIISVLITVLGGMLPARKAAKKDPVIALRTE